MRIDDPDAGTLRFAYDDAGNLLRETDARGRTIVHTYDAANRELTSEEEGREGASRVAFTYDRAETCATCTHTSGRVARVSYALEGGEVGVDELAYDARGQGVGLARTLLGRTFEFATRFDNVGRVVERRMPTGRTVATRYDAAGRLAAIDGYVAGVEYEARGLPAAVLYGNGVRATNAYDARMRLTRATVRLASGAAAGGATLQDLAYRYDAAGQLLALDDGAPVDGAPSFRAEYSYDGLGRVTRQRSMRGAAPRKSRTLPSTPRAGSSRRRPRTPRARETWASTATAKGLAPTRSRAPETRRSPTTQAAS